MATKEKEPAVEPESAGGEVPAGLDGWAALRAPFTGAAVGLLPKQVRKEDQAKFKCEPSNGRQVSMDGKYCGGFHALSVHLDFVGHAAVTDRLLRVDPTWDWQPLAMDAAGLPAFDSEGGLWIRLTILGVTRLGYGDSGGKRGPNAKKEAIGDALRNAAMRFGVALDLWSKGDLWQAEEDRGKEPGAGHRDRLAAQEDGEGFGPGGNGPRTAPSASQGHQQQRSAPAQPAAAARPADLPPEPPGIDWVAEVAQAGSADELLAVYNRAKRAGDLAYAISVDGKVQTVSDYIKALGVLMRKADEERAKTQKAQKAEPGYSEDELI